MHSGVYTLLYTLDRCTPLCTSRLAASCTACVYTAVLHIVHFSPRLGPVFGSLFLLRRKTDPGIKQLKTPKEVKRAKDPVNNSLIS